MNTIQVKVGTVGQRSEEYTLNSGAKVRDALQVAGKEADNLDIRINGSIANLDTTLSNGDFVLLSPRVKGGLKK